MCSTPAWYTAGGKSGGEPAAMLEDIRQEKMTVAHARTAYGVLVDPETVSVDRDATDAYRARIRETSA